MVCDYHLGTLFMSVCVPLDGILSLCSVNHTPQLDAISRPVGGALDPTDNVTDEEIRIIES